MTRCSSGLDRRCTRPLMEHPLSAEPLKLRSCPERPRRESQSTSRAMSLVEEYRCRVAVITVLTSLIGARGEKPVRGRRRFEVSGTDDLGDLHTFGTDNRERAEEIFVIMRQDLEDVELRENPWEDAVAGVIERS